MSELILQVSVLWVADDSRDSVVRILQGRRLHLIAKESLYVLHLQHLTRTGASDSQNSVVDLIESANVRVDVVYPSGHVLDGAVRTDLVDFRVLKLNYLVDLLVDVRLEDDGLEFHAGLNLAVQTHSQVDHVGD